MASPVKRLYGPAFLSNTYTTNIYNQASALLYSVIKKMHFVNVTAAPVTMRIYIDASGTNTNGKQLFYDYSIGANAEFNVYGALRLDSTDFLVGGASSSSAIVVTLEGSLEPV